MSNVRLTFQLSPVVSIFQLANREEVKRSLILSVH